MTEPQAPLPGAEADAAGLATPARGRFALPEDPNRRALALGALALGVILLLFVASRLVLGGDQEPEETAAPTPSGDTTTTTATTVPDGAGPSAESFEVFSTKNPFVPLINPSTGGGTTGGGTTGGGTTGGGGTGATQTTIRGGGGGSGATTTTRPSGASGGQANEPRRQQRVALLDVLRSDGRLVAQVRVNDTVHTVGEGDVFADNYRVLSIDEANECGRFIFGDEQFRLCRGEETLK